MLEAVQDAVDPELAALIDEREAAAKRVAPGRPWDEFRAELREQHGS